MSATNPSDVDSAASTETEDEEEYAHVSIAEGEVIIYNPDVTDEWLQSTDSVAVEDWE